MSERVQIVMRIYILEWRSLIERSPLHVVGWFLVAFLIIHISHTRSEDCKLAITDQVELRVLGHIQPSIQASCALCTRMTCCFSHTTHSLAFLYRISLFVLYKVHMTHLKVWSQSPTFCVSVNHPHDQSFRHSNLRAQHCHWCSLFCS